MTWHGFVVQKCTFCGICLYCLVNCLVMTKDNRKEWFYRKEEEDERRWEEMSNVNLLVNSDHCTLHFRHFAFELQPGGVTLFFFFLKINQWNLQSEQIFQTASHNSIINQKATVCVPVCVFEAINQQNWCYNENTLFCYLNVDEKEEESGCCCFFLLAETNLT